MIIASIRSFLILSAILLNFAAVSAIAKEVKDTPVPDDHLCDYVNFHHDEAKNAKGKGKCDTDCDCDGTRSCTKGKCTGTARPAKLTPEVCNSKDYHYNEKWTAAGPGKCSGDCECDGQRNCVSGECSGTAR